MNQGGEFMNKIYKHIWSKTLGRLVIVAEGVKGGGGKKAGRRRLRAACLATTLPTTLLSVPAWADGVLPTGGQIVSGSGSISTSGANMTVHQTTGKMIANWQSFSIGANNSATFNQPSASSVALNRVVGQSPSEILGRLNANGQVFLLNPNGVLIGTGAHIQTGGFVASTLGITNENFLAGNYNFTGTGGSILNQGDIAGKVVALIAPTVTNEGTITGDAALAGGTDVHLDFDGDGLISVTVNAATVATLVENKGMIVADGGLAILTAKGVSEAMKGVLNNSGIIEAKTLVNKNGRLLLLADMEHGEANVSGELKANFVETSAADVTLSRNLKVDT
ncbi:MAG: hypothetical protein FD142_3159 [bacterium]|nr:MAG: hypothetical protein FD142_3159 [bacterium]